MLPTPDNTYTYYRLLIYGDGTVIYEGYQGEDWGIVQGRHTTTVDPARIDALLYEFGRLDFFNIEGYPVIGSLPDIDHTDPMDFLFPLDDYPSGFAPARTIGLKIGDKHNAVWPGFAGSEKSDNTVSRTELDILINRVHVEADALQWVGGFLEEHGPNLTPTPSSPLPTPTQ